MNIFSKIKSKLRNSSKKESYSQLGEDLIVHYVFESFNVKRPAFIDIGAYDPKKFNNTYLFYKRGSRGINIEPNFKRFQKFNRYRSKDTNLNIGISKKPGVMTYYEMDLDVLNTFSKKEADLYVNQGHSIKNHREVQTNSIENVLFNCGYDNFPEFLTLDCEGMETQILETIDFKKSFPLVVCLETVEYSNQLGKGKKNNELISFMTENSYVIFSDTYVNTIFIHNSLIS